jgi:cathepsin L
LNIGGHSIDWRTEGVITPVQDEGSCDASWAFAATGAVESAYSIHKTSSLIDFSEQQLIDCSKNYGNFGCDGGLSTQAMKYLQSNDF